MEQFKPFDSLVIREKKVYAGVPATWKIKPTCCLADASDQEHYYLVPEKGLSLGFDVLKTSRTFTIYLVNRKGEEVLFFVKKTTFFENKLEIFDGNENLLGAVRKQGGQSKNNFQALDSVNRVFCEMEGEGDPPENFQIRSNGRVIGKISQQWPKTAEEGVYRNYHFGIVFPLDAEEEQKGILLGALFLIDFIF